MLPKLPIKIKLYSSNLIGDFNDTKNVEIVKWFLNNKIEIETNINYNYIQHTAVHFSLSEQNQELKHNLLMIMFSHVIIFWSYIIKHRS